MSKLAITAANSAGSLGGAQPISFGVSLPGSATQAYFSETLAAVNTPPAQQQQQNQITSLSDDYDSEGNDSAQAAQASDSPSATQNTPATNSASSSDSSQATDSASDTDASDGVSAQNQANATDSSAQTTSETLSPLAVLTAKLKNSKSSAGSSESAQGSDKGSATGKNAATTANSSQATVSGGDPFSQIAAQLSGSLTVTAQIAVAASPTNGLSTGGNASGGNANGSGSQTAATTTSAQNTNQLADDTAAETGQSTQASDLGALLEQFVSPNAAGTAQTPSSNTLANTALSASGLAAVGDASAANALMGGLTTTRLAGAYDFAGQLSAASNAAPGQSALTGGTASAVEQIALLIQRGVKSDQNQMTVQLHPEELGRVDVRLDFGKDGQVTASITADNQQTLDLLKQDSSALQRGLHDAGLNTDSNSLSFSLSSDQSNQSAAGYANSHQAQQSQTAALASTNASQNDDQNVADTVAAVALQLAPGRIDMRI